MWIVLRCDPDLQLFIYFFLQMDTNCPNTTSSILPNVNFIYCKLLNSGLTLTGNFHVCIKEITFQSTLLFKGLCIFPSSIPSTCYNENKRKGGGGNIKFDYNANRIKPPEQFTVCMYQVWYELKLHLNCLWT